MHVRRRLGIGLSLFLVACPALEETRGENGVLSFSRFDSADCLSQCTVPPEMPTRTTWHIAVRSDDPFDGSPDGVGVTLGDWELAHWCRSGSRSQRLESPDAMCGGTVYSVLTVDVHSADEASAAELAIRDPGGAVIDRVTFDVVVE